MTRRVARWFADEYRSLLQQPYFSILSFHTEAATAIAICFSIGIKLEKVNISDILLKIFIN